jgi:hypothetical protein
MKTRLLIFILGSLFAGKLASQTFLVDSITIDEVHSQLSIFSKDLDFAHAKVYVTGARLSAFGKISGGFAYGLPDSGDGSMGNISIFAGEAIDTNWNITRWFESINYLRTVPDSFYSPYTAYIPPLENVNYYFYFRTAVRSGLAGKNIRCPHLNRRSHATWDYTTELRIQSSYFIEDYSGSGNLRVAMDDSTNSVYSAGDSIYFSYGDLTNLACWYSFSYDDRNGHHTVASGNDTLYLEQQHFGVKRDSSGSVVPGNRSLKGSAWYNDTVATITISWSDLNSESPYIGPGDFNAVSQVGKIHTSLLPNYPNPVNASTTIPFTLGEGSSVTIEIRDPLGRIYAVLINGYYEAGTFELKFSAEHLPSGIYYVTMRTDKQTFTEPMLVAR